jgi:Ca2+-binding RTX toxin-like protein
MPLIIDLLNLLKIHVDGPQGHVFEGGAVVDVFAGTAGDDYVEGKGGLDILLGGAGSDTLGYASSNAGVTVDLAPGLLGHITQASGGDATGDIVTADFENLVGSNYNDTLKGTSGANVLAGLAGNDSLYGRNGNDRLIGGAGADLLDGGTGVDIADYSASAAALALVANAAGGWSGSGGDAQGDTLVSIETITGTTGDDTIDGSASTVALNFDGGGGNDTVIGGAGDDTFVVGAGVNNLSGGAGDDIFAITDAFFEGASNDPENPTDRGSIDGGEGDNTLDFSGMSVGVELTVTDQPPDDAIGAFAAATAPKTEYGLIAALDAVALTQGAPVLGNALNARFTDLNDTFSGGNLSEAVSGGGGNDLLEGKGGADRLDGGAGTDTAGYSHSSAAVTVDLSSSGAQSGGDAAGDTLISIENLIGSGFNDMLTGSGAANDIRGGAGNDTISGGDGNDALWGGAGRDILTGGAFFDTFAFEAISDSPSSRDASLDKIEDFMRGQDSIDLFAIDADSSIAGDQAFDLIGSGAFSGLGQLRVIASTDGYLRVEANTNGTLSPDFAILVKSEALTASDFIL